MFSEISRADMIREAYRQGYAPNELPEKYGVTKQAVYWCISNIERPPDVAAKRSIFTDRTWTLERMNLFIGYAEAGARPLEIAFRLGIAERRVPGRIRALLAAGLISQQIAFQRELIERLKTTDDVEEAGKLLPMVSRHSFELNSRGENPVFVSLKGLARVANLPLGPCNSIKPIQRGLDEAGITYGTVPVIVKDDHTVFSRFTLKRFIPCATEALSKSWRFARNPEDICSRFRSDAYSYFIKQGIPDDTALELASKVLESELPYIRGERGQFRIFQHLAHFHKTVMRRKFFDYHRAKMKEEKTKNSPKVGEDQRTGRRSGNRRKEFLRSNEHLFSLLEPDKRWILKLRMEGLQYSQIAQEDEKGRSVTNLRQLAYKSRRQLANIKEQHISN